MKLTERERKKTNQNNLNTKRNENFIHMKKATMRTVQAEENLVIALHIDFIIFEVVHAK